MSVSSRVLSLFPACRTTLLFPPLVSVLLDAFKFESASLPAARSFLPLSLISCAPRSVEVSRLRQAMPVRPFSDDAPLSSPCYLLCVTLPCFLSLPFDLQLEEQSSRGMDPLLLACFLPRRCPLLPPFPPLMEPCPLVELEPTLPTPAQACYCFLILSLPSKSPPCARPLVSCRTERLFQSSSPPSRRGSFSLFGICSSTNLRPLSLF